MRSNIHTVTTIFFPTLITKYKVIISNQGVFSSAPTSHPPPQPLFFFFSFFSFLWPANSKKISKYICVSETKHTHVAVGRKLTYKYVCGLMCLFFLSQRWYLQRFIVAAQNDVIFINWWRLGNIILHIQWTKTRRASVSIQSLLAKMHTLQYKVLNTSLCNKCMRQRSLDVNVMLTTC